MIRRSFALGLILVVASACSWFDDPSPDSVFVNLDDGTGQYRMIVSSVFVAGTNELNQTRVELLEADTFFVAAPFSREVNIRGDQRFFVEVRSAADTTSAQAVRVTVSIDRQPRFEAFADVAERPIRFVYQFNHRPVEDIVEVF